MNIDKILELDNIATKLKSEQLEEIGNTVSDGFDTDCQSRDGWEKDVKEWTKLALQVSEIKNYPWPNASNVKFPLVSVAAMQFSARAYPTLVPFDGRVVRCKVIGKDPDGQKQLRAERISKHMSYQIMEEMDNWEGEMDRLLVIVPIIGFAYKKTYFDPCVQKNVSKLLLPQDLIVNYWAKNVESAERKTEVMYLHKRKVVELQRLGEFRNLDLKDPEILTATTNSEVSNTEPPSKADETSPYKFLEHHCFLDLDDDGYAEPYIVTIRSDTKEVFSIRKRFTKDRIIYNDIGEIAYIRPIEYYTQYDCIPNPDGSGYSIGFGKLLGPLNCSVDTIINQLVDSGTLNNLQAGFIGKGLRIKMSDTIFKPGEWKAVNAIGDDIRKQLVPLPANPPSPVLFQLLGMLVQSAKELASVAEIFVGKMPGQNTPAYTTKETVEQGMKLFTAIYKRIYRALKQEFQKLYLLNRDTLDMNTIIEVLDEEIRQNDYQLPENDIVPAADPSAASKTEKEAQAQQLLAMLQIGTLDPIEVTVRALAAMEVPMPEKLIRQPGPSPEQQKMQAEMQMEQQRMQGEMQMKGQEHQMKMQLEEMKMQMKRMEMSMKLQTDQMKMIMDMQKAKQDMAVSEMEHEQQMRHQEGQMQMDTVKGAIDHKQQMEQSAQNHEQNMTQMKEKNKNTPKKSKKSLDK